MEPSRKVSVSVLIAIFYSLSELHSHHKHDHQQHLHFVFTDVICDNYGSGGAGLETGEVCSWKSRHGGRAIPHVVDRP